MDMPAEGSGKKLDGEHDKITTYLLRDSDRKNALHKK